MDAQLLNFKPYSSGLMVGFFDLCVAGIVVTGCKAFKKDDSLWFAWPSEKGQDKEGKDQWRDIVTAAEPVMRNLQGQIRGQLREALQSTPEGRSLNSQRPGGSVLHSKGIKEGSRRPQAENIDQYQSKPGQGDDLPF